MKNFLEEKSQKISLKFVWLVQHILMKFSNFTTAIHLSKYVLYFIYGTYNVIRFVVACTLNKLSELRFLAILVLLEEQSALFLVSMIHDRFRSFMLNWLWFIRWALGCSKLKWENNYVLFSWRIDTFRFVIMSTFYYFS